MYVVLVALLKSVAARSVDLVHPSLSAGVVAKLGGSEAYTVRCLRNRSGSE